MIADEEKVLDCVVCTSDPGYWLRSGGRNPAANSYSHPYPGSGQSGTYSYTGAGATDPYAQADSYVCPYPCP